MTYTKNAILFVDTVCPAPYSPNILELQPLGGTEATVVRIAEALGKSHPVTVAQHCRLETLMTSAAFYTGLKQEYLERKFHAIVALRLPQVAINLKLKHKETPVYLWMHDMPDVSILGHAKIMGELGIGIICVSMFQQRSLYDLFKMDGTITKFPRVTVLYNPVDDSLQPDQMPVDKNKLVFFSSPHKGLSYTLHAFQAARRLNKDFKLYVSNPSYYKDFPDLDKQEGVANCGGLSHKQAIGHVRSALCVFYPNHVFPETFGLVYAESNAVGTPVLTHPFGAASEVLGGGTFQTCDTRDIKVLIDKLMNWYDGGRPKVSMNPAFRTSKVINGWKDLVRV